MSNTFEENMKRLDEILEKVEDGTLNLDESIKNFEEGMKICKDLDSKLKEAEKKAVEIFEEK